LHREDAEKPDEPFTLFNLGQVYYELGRAAEALPRLRRSLERSHPQDSIVRKLYALIACCHRALGQPAEALAACQAGRVHYPEDAELLFTERVLRWGQGDLARAKACLRQLLEVRPGAHFASVDADLRRKARHILGAILFQEGQHAAAEQEWRVVVAERPDFMPGWTGLGDICLVGQRWAELEEVTRRLAALPGGEGEARLLRARGHMARQEFGLAQGLLQAAAAAEPQDPRPRVLLSHALLQENQGLVAAEQALLDVLALEPDHAEARRNLAALVRRQA
jgi:tetratricopeptide (TPR) repeat protein